MSKDKMILVAVTVLATAIVIKKVKAADSAAQKLADLIPVG